MLSRVLRPIDLEITGEAPLATSGALATLRPVAEVVPPASEPAVGGASTATTGDHGAHVIRDAIVATIGLVAFASIVRLALHARRIPH